MPPLQEIEGLSMPMLGGGGRLVDGATGDACGRGGGGGGGVDGVASDTFGGEGGGGGGRVIGGGLVDGVASDTC
jgi:hypothetical protein